MCCAENAGEHASTINNNSGQLFLITTRPPQSARDRDLLAPEYAFLDALVLWKDESFAQKDDIGIQGKGAVLKLSCCNSEIVRRKACVLGDFL
jgi:hypothetical protein